MSTTNYSATMPFECISSFNPTIEILKYLGTISYLLPGCVLHLLILRSILVTRREYLKNSSFFTIFALDSIASITLTLIDIFFGRLFVHISPLCPIVGPYFWNPSIILKFYYYTYCHVRFAKIIAQAFMVLNRMTCVLVPTYYTGIWKTLTPLSIIIILLGPIGGTWYLLLSPRFYAVSSYGGFAVNYFRAVPWASVSVFQSIYILTVLGFTVICTTVTLFKLVFMENRVKAAEKSLCFTSVFISFTFLLVAGTQLFYIVCESCRVSDYLYTAQFLAFDLFTVGSAVILILTNSQLRESIFSTKSNRVFLMATHNSVTH